MVRGPDSRSVFLFILRFLFYNFQIHLTGFCRSPCSNLQSASPSASSSLYRENSGIIAVASLSIYPSPSVFRLSVCLNACVCLPLARPRAWPGTLAPPPFPRPLQEKAGGQVRGQPPRHLFSCFFLCSLCFFCIFCDLSSSPLLKTRWLCSFPCPTV